MLRLALIILLCTNHFLVYSQQSKRTPHPDDLRISVSEVFDSIGKFKFANRGNYFFLKNSVKKLSNISGFNFKDSSLHKKSLELFSQKIRNTRRNLLNDSLNLKSAYCAIWGDSFYEKYLGELESMERSLISNGNLFDRAEFLPGPQHLKSLSGQKDSNYPKIHVDTNGDLEASILYIVQDPFKQLVINYYNSIHDSPVRGDDLDKIYEYLEGWRALELIYTKRLEIREKLQYYKDNVHEFDAFNEDAVRKSIEKYNEEFNMNFTLKLIRDSMTIIKKMLWLNEGFIFINPFYSSDGHLAYPTNERMQLVTDVQRKIIDSLSKSGYLKSIQQSEILWNEVTVPLFSDTKKENQVLGFSMDNNAIKYLDETNPLLDIASTTLLVHNTPGSVDLELEVSNTGKSNRRIVDDLNSTLNDAATSIGGLLTRTGQIGILLDRLNPPDFNEEKKVNIFDLIYNSTALKDTLKSQPSPDASEKGIIKGGKLVIKRGEVNTVGPFELSDNSNYNKKTIILYDFYYFDSFNYLRQNKLVKIVDQFITTDEYIVLKKHDFAGIKKIEIDSLLYRFQKYYCFIKEREKKYISILNKYQKHENELEHLLRIFIRSLPPEKLNSTQNKTPQFLTKKFPVTYTNKTKELSIVGKITSKEDKKVIDQDVLFPKIRVKYQPTFDFSAGLIWTLSDYKIAKKVDSGLPSMEEGNKIQFMASFQAYPFRFLNRYSKFRTCNFSSNFFFFAGLTIPKPLDNFIFGIGYSVIPDIGVKIFAGYHFYANYRYDIYNNQMVDRAFGFSSAGPTLGFGLNPSTVIKSLGIIQ